MDQRELLIDIYAIGEFKKIFCKTIYRRAFKKKQNTGES